LTNGGHHQEDLIELVQEIMQSFYIHQYLKIKSMLQGRDQYLILFSKSLFCSWSVSSITFLYYTILFEAFCYHQMCLLCNFQRYKLASFKQKLFTSLTCWSL